MATGNKQEQTTKANLRYGLGTWQLLIWWERATAFSFLLSSLLLWNQITWITTGQVVLSSSWRDLVTWLSVRPPFWSGSKRWFISSPPQSPNIKKNTSILSQQCCASAYTATNVVGESYGTSQRYCSLFIRLNSLLWNMFSAILCSNRKQLVQYRPKSSASAIPRA